ncbi:N-formyl peptide receptor 3-like [Phyllobates terribilis]|uniref:N-formyl peptide receptor 3-like n=1 Tax=Phyllobates terribilis TaxID=111132 RepID=UPI003CCAAC16
MAKTRKLSKSPDQYDKTDDFYFYYYDSIIQTVAITLYSIVFALGIIGNGLVIWIAGFRMKNTISAMWFLNLAIADFFCCASLPLRIAEWAVVFSQMINLTYCKVNVVLFNLNLTASVLLLTAMSIDRWVSVMWPFWAKVHRTYKLVIITAAIIWGLSLIVSGLVYHVYQYHIDDLTEWCLFVFNIFAIFGENHELYQPMQLIRLIIMFVIPFLIIFSTYVTIFFRLKKSKRSQRSQRSSRIITAVILCFFICWFPYYILPLTPWYNIRYSLFLIVQTIITSLACFNSCINPIIYVFMSPDFQQGFFRSIPSRLERALGDHPNDLSREREDTGNTRTTDA